MNRPKDLAYTVAIIGLRAASAEKTSLPSRSPRWAADASPNQLRLGAGTGYLGVVLCGLTALCVRFVFSAVSA
jgi:hypothetical protein